MPGPLGLNIFAAMKMYTLFLRLLWPLLLLVVVSSCRTCPILSCHTRKVHFHDGVKYRGQPIFKKQNPAIGEKIKVYNPRSKKRKADKSKTLR